MERDDDFDSDDELFEALGFKVIVERDTSFDKIDCEICRKSIVRKDLDAHLNACAKDSNLVYYLKMALLHILKKQDVAHIVLHTYNALRDNEPVFLVKGVCLYCETPADHRNGGCQMVSRTDYLKKVISKTEGDYFYNLSQQIRFEKKTSACIQSIKNRKELLDILDKFENSPDSVTKTDPLAKDLEEWPISPTAQIREIHEKHEKLVKAEIERVDTEKKKAQEETRKGRDHVMRGFIKYLEELDRKDPVDGRAFRH
ncbi:unnamed protein product [Caenorhabditis sp. 36 PRJEB53466]|nr:unnamed protein product [Caenorhabditis sp. 36 PRJEB53466]